MRFWTVQARRWLAEIDTGVVVARGDGLVAAPRPGAMPSELPIGRIGHATPLHAMTVGRGQGSEFDELMVLLPSADSPLAIRELLYTAVTRRDESGQSGHKRQVQAAGTCRF